MTERGWIYHGNIDTTNAKILVQVTEWFVNVGVPPFVSTLCKLIEGAWMTRSLDGTEYNVVTKLCPIFRMQWLLRISTNRQA